MEAGSLLEQALKSNPSISETATTKNVLILDVYALEEQKDNIQQLLGLAKLAAACNSHLQSKEFRWHFGGDGPVFGVHVGEEGIPHLRAYCRYGPSVADEWTAIERMFTLSQDVDQDIAISCWDVEDGQVILIQTAEVLPDWLDQDPTDTHRYACWIRQGTLQILSQSHITLPDALNQLRNQDRHQRSSHPHVQDALQLCLQRNQTQAHVDHRTPLVVPRKVATMIRNRPDLIHAAIQAFSHHIEEVPPKLLDFHDWVWTTALLSRTNYAMLRTMVSPAWKSIDYVPPIGVEVKRYTRQCNMDSTPHLRHAVHLGVRLVVGLEYLSAMDYDPVSIHARIAYWSRIEKESHHGDRGEQGDSYILENFKQGPNDALHDLTDILRCPVFPEEAHNLSLYAYPEVSMKQQLLNARKTADPDEDFPIPVADQVDDDAWLTLGDGKGLENNNDLDAILSRFQNFMTQPSDFEGVTMMMRPKSRKDIRPRIFMNILHDVLKGGPISFPKSEDHFFYREDYDLMDEEVGDDQHADSEEDIAMQGLMNAMDRELQQKSTSRDFDGIGDGEEGDRRNNSHALRENDRDLAENAHVLSNILQSLEASAGEAGPVPNMLKGMGARKSE